MQNTLNRVLKIAGIVFGVDDSQLNAGTMITENLNPDSIEVAEFAISLEKEFGVSIALDEINPAGSLGRLSAILDERRAHKATSGRTS